jgi:hypothetical protein
MKYVMPAMVLAALVVTAAPVSADALKEFGCGRTLQTAGGQAQPEADAHLHVLDQTSAGTQFDPGPVPPGTTVKSIFCDRSDIVPAPSDYKVVKAGYPLMILARDATGRTRIAVLELDGGQLKLRSVGELGFTPDMIQRIQAVLDASLPQFGKTVTSR